MSTPDGPRFCTECGAPLPADAKFCGQCGTKVARPEASPAPAPAEPDVGFETLPPDLRAKFEAARQELRGERREVVVLFADVSGYTAMSERLDPEEVSLMMQGLMRELADAVYRYEGYVDKYIGDAIMALFGAPVSHEDDPERALLSALDMLQVTARHRERGSEIHLRVGLNIGDVVAAHMGSEMRLQYTVMGDAVNVASRLEGKAEPDTILISHALYERVSTVFETEEVPPVTVKGKAEPLRVHRVVRYRPAPVDGDRVRTPFVGRETELAEMESYLGLVDSADVPPPLVEAEAGRSTGHEPRDHRPHLGFRGPAAAGHRELHRARSVFRHFGAAGARGEEDDPAGMAEDDRRPRAPRMEEAFDRHLVGRALGEERAYLRIDRDQALGERSRARSDDSRVQVLEMLAVARDQAVAGGARAGIDPEDHHRARHSPSGTERAIRRFPHPTRPGPTAAGRLEVGDQAAEVNLAMTSSGMSKFAHTFCTSSCSSS